MAKKIITALSAGLSLAVATGCGPKTEGPTENPPPPEPVQVDPQPTANPPPPEPPPGNPPPPAEVGLPTWNDVVNPAPPDGMPAEPPSTNPPTPHLQTTGDGRCYVVWVDPRREPPAGPYDPASGGTQILCPEKDR